MTTLRLAGCTPEPLAAYLKALAVLRLVAEQKDREARGFWKDDIFFLQSNLDESALIGFFLEEYSPTPIIAPWNGGSGFYEGDQMQGIDVIRESNDPRFGPYRHTVGVIDNWEELPPQGEPLQALLARIEREVTLKKTGTAKLITAADRVRRAADFPAVLQLRIRDLETRADISKQLLKEATKARTEANRIWRERRKSDIVQACRSRLPAPSLEWIDAAIGLSAERKLSFPPVLGSGGNEGNLEYTNGFMRRIAELLLAPANSQGLLENALFGRSALEFVQESVGQFEPGRAGGFNQGPGIEHKDVPTNPWSFVLAMEGTIVWASTAARRNSAHGASSPFTVRSRAVGFPSAARTEDAKARAEIWAPIWHRPVPYRELRAFLGEGRAEIGRRGARDGIEFAEAVGSLGVDRGVTQFVRYGLIKRRGDSYIALPEGRLDVLVRTETDLIRQLEPLLARLDGFLRGFRGEVPPRLASARRKIDERIYAALSRGGATAMKELVVALGRMERLVAQRDRSKDPKLQRPLAGLRPAWIAAADDGTVEVRIAAALTSIAPTGKVGPLRANLSPVDPERPYRWADHGRQTAWQGNALATRLAGVLARRMMDAERLDSRRNPLHASVTLALGDVAAFLDGTLEEGLLEDMLFGFTLVNWRDRESVASLRKHLKASAPPSQFVLPTSYHLLKLLFLPRPLDLGEAKVEIRPEAAIVPLLLGGRIHDACRIAQRRLFAAGLRPVTSDFPDGEDGARLAAALLLPVSATRILARRALLEDEAHTR